MASSNWRTPPRWTAFTTPSAEKPVDGGEDHNVWIYYPITAGGGGVKKVLREKGSKSSDLYPDHPANVRRTRPSCTTRGSCRPDEEVLPFNLAKNWQYKTVFSIRLGHVERVADRIDPKPVMHFNDILSVLVLHPHSHPLSPKQAFQRILHFHRNRKK